MRVGLGEDAILVELQGVGSDQGKVFFKRFDELADGCVASSYSAT